MKKTDLRPPVVVLGLYIPGISIIKNFEKENIRCIGVDYSNGIMGFYLRKKELYVCPDPDVDAEAWLNFMIDLRAEIGRKPILITTSDKYLIPLNRYKKILQNEFIYPVLDNDIIEELLSKRGLFNIAKAAGVPTPDTRFIGGIGDIEGISRKEMLPCLIKPEFSHLWRNERAKEVVGDMTAIKVNNRKELEDWYKKIKAFDKKFIIQEIIEGPNSNLFYFVSYLNRKQECLGYFVGNKIRITPPHFGHGSYVETVSDGRIKNTLYDLSMRLLRHCKYWGLSGIEFKLDKACGDFKLIEINPRFGLWDDLGRLIGVDVAYIYYSDLLGQGPKQQELTRTKAKWVSLSNDISAFFEYRREGHIGFFEWIKTLSDFSNTVYSDFYWNEPKLIYYWSLRRVSRRLKKGIFKKNV